MQARLFVAGLAACSTLAITAPLLAAPSMPRCVPATMSPTSKSFPASLPGFAYSAQNATTSDVHLFAIGATRTELPLTVGPVVDAWLQVKPATALVPGTSYELDFASFCSLADAPYPQAPLTFTVTDAVPLPTRFGDLQAPPTIILRYASTKQYLVTASYALAAEMKPWTSAYKLAMTFDGRPTKVASTFAPSGDTVQIDAYGFCDGQSSTAGTHTVQLRATLPFAAPLELPSSEVTFTCPTASSSSSSSGGGCATPPGSAARSGAPSWALALGIGALALLARAGRRRS
jgi:hypothetical protein